MKWLISPLFFLLFISNPIKAQKPDWVSFEQRKSLYPAEEFFKGFSLTDVGKSDNLGESLERAKENAISNLSNSVQVTVESISTLNTLEVNDELKQEFKENIASFSRVDLAGINTQTYHDKRKDRVYAFAFVKKDDLADYYLKQVSLKKNEIASKIEMADDFASSGQRGKALKSYFECKPLFTEIKEAQSMIILLKASSEELNEVRGYQVKVEQAITELYQSDLVSLKEVSGLIAQALHMQTGELEGKLRLASFTFEDTRMGSRFSRRLHSELEQALIQTGGFNIESNHVSFNGGTEQPEYLLNGTYWEENGRIKVLAVLRKMQDGSTIASADGYLPKLWLNENRISWKPENFAQAHENMMQFRQDEIVDGNMKLEVWTSKGNESPIFLENDTLSFYVRMSHPAYVRIINHFADGSRVLLVDNMYIGADKVNKVVEIPQRFQCAPPFGAEVLQVNAQTDAFKSLKTSNKYGYQFIDDDLSTILKTNRGFKPIKNEDLKAEKRIVVTTMSR